MHRRLHKHASIFLSLFFLASFYFSLFNPFLFHLGCSCCSQEGERYGSIRGTFRWVSCSRMYVSGRRNHSCRDSVTVQHAPLISLFALSLSLSRSPSPVPSAPSPSLPVLPPRTRERGEGRSARILPRLRHPRRFLESRFTWLAAAISSPSRYFARGEGGSTGG